MAFTPGQVPDGDFQEVAKHVTNIRIFFGGGEGTTTAEGERGDDSWEEAEGESGDNTKKSRPPV
jgi:hypothetical protein